MISVVSVAKKLSRGEFSYAIGRFHRARQAYSLWQHRASPVIERGERLGRSLVSVDVDSAVASLRRDGIFYPLQLPEAVVRRLAQCAASSPLCSHLSGIDGFTYADVEHGRWHGLPIVLGDVVKPGDIAEIAELCSDPTLLSIAAEYLRYEPKRITPWFFWSFAGDFTEQERRDAGQTFEFHFDVHGYNFVYLNFYITPVDVKAGAHQLVIGSHTKKPLRLLLNSAIANSSDVQATYGQSAVETVEGPAGTGFFEDASCYHLAVPPRDRDRLMLQIRYS